jgi:protein-S-isoprenylcysteine O-methyltransferase Ste14
MDSRALTPPVSNLLLKALFAFLALPGIVAFMLPWLFRPRGASIHPEGIPAFTIGVIVLLWCVRDFYVAGRGTLAPWSPPRNLVTIGLYRFSRNPMYVGVLLILAGWALVFASRTLWQYAAVVAIGFHLRVVMFEEPWLRQTHGRAFDEYVARVPRWIGLRHL